MKIGITQFLNGSITPINHLRGLPVQAIGNFPDSCKIPALLCLYSQFLRNPAKPKRIAPQSNPKRVIEGLFFVRTANWPSHDALRPYPLLYGCNYTLKSPVELWFPATLKWHLHDLQRTALLIPHLDQVSSWKSRLMNDAVTIVVFHVSRQQGQALLHVRQQLRLKAGPDFYRVISSDLMRPFNASRKSRTSLPARRRACPAPSRYGGRVPRVTLVLPLDATLPRPGVRSRRARPENFSASR